MGQTESVTTEGSANGDLKAKIAYLIECHDKGRACIPPIHNQFYPGLLQTGQLPKAGCWLTAAVFGENDCKPLDEIGMLGALDNKFHWLHDSELTGEDHTLFSAIIRRYDTLAWSDEQVTEWLQSL